MAAGPWDNVQLPGPPNGPAWAQAAAQLMGATQGSINNAFNAYQQGQNFQYQQQQRNFFQDPNNLAALQQAMPQNQYSGLITSLLQSGGTPAIGQASQLIPTLQRQQLIDQYTQDNGGQQSQQPNPTAPAAGSPEQITGQKTSGQPTIDPTGGPTGTTLNYLAAQTHTDLDGFLSAYPQYRGWLNRDLNDNQAKAIQTRMQQYRSSGSPDRGGGNPVAQSGGGDQEAAGSNELRPSMGEGSSAVSPRQTGERRVAQNAAQPEGNPPLGAGAMVPQQFRQNPQAFADMLHQQADDLRKRNRLGELIGISSKTAEDRANSYDKRADQIEEAIGKEAGLTKEQQNERSGTTSRIKAEEGRIASGQKELDSINKMGADARIANDKLKLPMRLVNDPGFYSGPLEGVNRAYKQWSAVLGGNPNAGVPQEAFKKSVNDLLSEQIRTMAASGVGRILLTEVQTMKDSIASLGTTRATDRLLLEEVNRLHNYQIGVQDLASAYLKTHNYLDQGFYQQLARFHDQHPMYTEAELRDPRLIAPPRMPSNITRDPVSMRQWGKTMGLNDGDPFAGEDGSGPYKFKMQ